MVTRLTLVRGEVAETDDELVQQQLFDSDDAVPAIGTADPAVAASPAPRAVGGAGRIVRDICAEGGAAADWSLLVGGSIFWNAAIAIGRALAICRCRTGGSLITAAEDQLPPASGHPLVDTFQNTIALHRETHC
jgi:hypothetical protein